MSRSSIQPCRLSVDTFDAAHPQLGLTPVVAVATLLPRRERPRHALGALKQIANDGRTQRRQLETEAVKTKIGTHPFDAGQDRLDLSDVSVALEQRSDNRADEILVADVTKITQRLQLEFLLFFLPFSFYYQTAFFGAFILVILALTLDYLQGLHFHKKFIVGLSFLFVFLVFILASTEWAI